MTNQSSAPWLVKPVFCAKCGKPFFGNPGKGSCSCPAEPFAPDIFAAERGRHAASGYFFISDDELRRIVAEEVERALARRSTVGDGK